MQKQIEDDGNIELKDNMKKFHYISVLKKVLEKKLSKEENSLTNATVLFTPFLSFGINRVQRLKTIKRERNLQYLIQMNFILEDLKNPEVFELGDRYIDENTMSFIPNILLNLYYFSVGYTNESLLNINQFLYLINSTYYDDIKKECPRLSRNKLVETILKRIGTISSGKISKFDVEDAKMVLKNIPLNIPSSLKDEIIKEFSNSKEKDPTTGKYEFKILRRDVSSEYLSKMYNRCFEKEFDNYNVADYDKLIKEIESSLSSILSIEIKNNWDLNALKDMSNYIIENYHNLLKRQYPNYSPLGLVSMLIYELIGEANKSKNHNIGSNEIYDLVERNKILPGIIKKDVETSFKNTSTDCRPNRLKIKLFEKTLFFNPKLKPRKN